MKDVMIFAASVLIPITSYSKPLKSLIPSPASGKTSCVNFGGNWTGECQEKDGNESRTYQSSYRVTQDGCDSIALFGSDSAYETFEIGRTNMTNQSEHETFINVTAYVNWSDSGAKLGVEQHWSAEFSFEGERKIASGNRQVRIELREPENIILTESSSSTTQSQSGSGVYEASLECSYKIIR